MKSIFSILKGMVMGVANIIPGVSGGTMAVSMGIYDDIISAVTHLFKDFKKSVLTLLPYFVGMGLAIVGLSYAIDFFLHNYNLQTNFLFIGLILGGLPVILSRFKGKKVGVGAGIAFVVAFAVIIGLQLAGTGGDVEIKVNAIGIIKLFLIGVIASATMVVPGVSGSMILMILGYYGPIISEVKNFFSALKEFDMPALIDGAMILVPFGLGVVIGIFAIAKLIEFLLKNYEVITFGAILGLIVASPFAIFMSAEVPAVLSFGSVSVSVVTFVVGLVIAFFLGRE